MKTKKSKKVKAWAVLQKGKLFMTLMKNPAYNKFYMRVKTTEDYTHFPCTITYTIPNNKKI